MQKSIKKQKRDEIQRQFFNTVTVFGRELLEDGCEFGKYFGFVQMNKTDGKPKFAVVTLEAVDLDVKRVKIRYTTINSYRESWEGYKEVVSIAKPDLYNRFFKADNIEELVTDLIEVNK